MPVPEVRASYLTMGVLLSLVDDDSDGEVDGENVRRRGGVDEDESAAAALSDPYRPSSEPARSWI